MRVLWLLATALLTPIHPAISSDTDDYPRRIGIDIEHYRFEITLSDDRDVIVGRTTVTVRFTSNGATELLLDLTSRNEQGQGMTVGSVTSGAR